MNTSSKNNKNIFRTFLMAIAVVFAIGFSAFTNAPKENNLATRYWGNDGTNYTLIPASVGLPSSGNCDSSPAQPLCIVQSDDTSIPDEFPKNNPDNHALTQYSGSAAGFYNP